MSYSKNIIAFVVTFVIIITIWILGANFPLEIDDVGDLVRGCNIIQSHASIEYGPLYQLNYCIFKSITLNPIVAFYLKTSAVIFLMSISFGILAYTQIQDPLISTGVAIWLSFIFLSYNGTSEFAFILAFVGALAASIAQNNNWSIFFIGVTLAFFVRTEYLIGILSGIIIAISHSAHTRSYQTHAAGIVVGMGCFLACVGLFAATPRAEESRLWIAFGQHFALNQAQSGTYESLSWTDWRTMIQSEFPTSTDLSEALLENPSAVQWHIQQNLTRRLPGALITLLTPTPLLQPSLLWNLVVGGSIVLSLLILAGFGVTAMYRYKRLLPLFALTPIPMISILFIMPQARHLLPFLPLLVVCIVYGIKTLSTRNWYIKYAIRTWFMLILSISLVFMLIQTMSQSQTVSFRAIAPMISASIQGDDHLVILGSERICKVLDLHNCLSSEWGETDIPSEYFYQTQPQWIVALPDWTARQAVRTDQVMLQLLATPEEFGCETVLITREKYQIIACR